MESVRPVAALPPPADGSPTWRLAMLVAAIVAACPAAVVAADSAAARPVTGTEVPELAPLDRAMLAFMDDRGIPCGTLAVMREGRIVLSRGYGHADEARSQAIEPDAPLRLASLVKPLTAAAVRRLVSRAALDEQTRVVEFLGLADPPPADLDPRWLQITVGQLLDHRGGFDRQAAGDPMFQSREIAAALGLAGPSSAADTVRFMLRRPLDFDPGARTAYSNFGYCLLGRVIEKAVGRPYVDVLRDEILAPLGIGSVALGRSLPADRDPREPWYHDPQRTTSVFDPAARETVRWPDGGFHLEAMDAHGGLVGSAPDMVRFLAHYGFDGRPVTADHRPAGQFFGSLPGTFTVMARRGDGIILAALFNQRGDASGLAYMPILEDLGAAIDGVMAWPDGGAPTGAPRTP